MSIILISLIAALAWAIKDAIKAKSIQSIISGWPKYAGCFAAGVAYGYLAGWKYFRYLSVVGVIALVGNSFNDVKTFLLWALAKIHGK
jgi:hypothetical protein